MRLWRARGVVRGNLWLRLNDIEGVSDARGGPYLTDKVPPPGAPKGWLDERSRVTRLQEMFKEELDDLFLVERQVGAGWGDIVTSVAGISAEGMSDGARLAKLAVRDLPSRRNLAPDAGGLGRPTPFEVANELMPFFNALHEEGALLEDTECREMLLGTAGGETMGILGLSHEQIVEIADEIIDSRRWDQAYQHGVCNYLLALDAALSTADTLVEWVDTWGDDEIREQPDWFKLLIAREI